MTAGMEFDKGPIRPDKEGLARLEHGHAEAVQAGMDLKAQWKQEDAVIAEARRFEWAAHEQGARDRDAMRVKLGGASLIEADARATREAADARLKAADEAAAKLKDDGETKAKAAAAVK